MSLVASVRAVGFEILVSAQPEVVAIKTFNSSSLRELTCAELVFESSAREPIDSCDSLAFQGHIIIGCVSFYSIAALCIDFIALHHGFLDRASVIPWLLFPSCSHLRAILPDLACAEVAI